MNTYRIIAKTNRSVRTNLLARLGRQSWLRFLVSLMVILFHVALSNRDYDIVESMVAGMCGALAANVFWRYLSREEKPLPVLEWVMFQLYVYFVMPIFFEGVSTRSTNFLSLSRSGAVLKSLVAVNLFALSLMIGWKFLRMRKKENSNASQRTLSPIIVLVYGAISLVVSFLLARYEYELKMEWYRSVLNNFFSPTIAQVLLLFESQRKPNNRGARLNVWIYTGIMVVMGLLGSRLDDVLSPLVTAGIGVMMIRQRILKSLVAASIAIFLVFNPAKLVYRQITGYRTTEFKTLTISQMIDAWKSSIEDVWSSGKKSQNTALDTTSSRLNYLSINASVIDVVPQRIPYAFGKPWSAILIGVVPRFIWPEKPNMTEITNNKFNILFGFTTRAIAESSTSAYPAVADGFWNLGWVGVATAGLLAGLFWKSIYILWTPGSRFRYVLAFFLLINTKASVAFPNLVIGVIQAVVACLLVVKFLEIVSKLGVSIRKSTT